MELLDTALKQGLFPALVVAIYLIIIKLIDAKKENYQAKLNSNLVNSIEVISKFIKDITSNIINKDQDKCEYAIENSFQASALRLVQFVSTTVINNNINDNRESILSNIHNIVNSEFYTIYSVLSLYTINNTKVSTYLNKQWMSDIEQDIIAAIYNNKLNKEDRILSFINKININFQNYITYISNNIIK